MAAAIGEADAVAEGRVAEHVAECERPCRTEHAELPGDRAGAGSDPGGGAVARRARRGRASGSRRGSAISGAASVATGCSTPARAFPSLRTRAGRRAPRSTSRASAILRTAAPPRGMPRDRGGAETVASAEGLLPGVPRLSSRARSPAAPVAARPPARQERVPAEGARATASIPYGAVDVVQAAAPATSGQPARRAGGGAGRSAGIRSRSRSRATGWSGASGLLTGLCRRRDRRGSGSCSRPKRVPVVPAHRRLRDRARARYTCSRPVTASTASRAARRTEAAPSRDS